MCSVNEYWTRIKNIPLILERGTGDGDAFICRTLDGEPVRVTRPELLQTDEKRAAAIELYESLYKRAQN